MFDINWEDVDLLSYPSEDVLTRNTQDIFALTDRLARVREIAEMGGEAVDKLHRPSDLEQVLVEELDRLYERQDIFNKIKGLQDLGIF